MEGWGVGVWGVCLKGDRKRESRTVFGSVIGGGEGGGGGGGGVGGGGGGGGGGGVICVT